MPRRELGLGMAGCNPGSCDSMVSTASNHSQQSDNSFDYLSVEEKECLMFLEETIGSLDAEADSGVSTDETDYTEPSKLPGTWPKRDSVPQDLENGGPPTSAGQQHAAEQMGGQSISTFSSTAPAAAPSPGYYSLPRGITAADAQRAHRVSGSRVTAHAVQDPVPAGKPSQEVSNGDKLDQANVRIQMKSLESLIIQPPDPFQDDLVSHEWSRSHRSGGRRETGKETKTWTSWGQTERSVLEEMPQDTDAKHGPPTAPKPRKLPPNIILKTSKSSSGPQAAEPGQRGKAPSASSAGPQPGSAGDTAAEKANSGHLDPKEREKAHQEALEKLGLSQSSREPRAPFQPREPPVPAPGQPEPRRMAAEPSGPGIRQLNFKSNTLERSGVGLGSYVASAKEQSVKTSSSLGKMSFIERLAPSFLRSSRPRPAALGAGQDLAGLQEPGQAEQDKSSKRRSHPLPGFPRAPRSAVSVKISPKGATDENRREALKKLGLLKE